MNTLNNRLKLIWWQRHQPRATSITQAKAKQTTARANARLAVNGAKPPSPARGKGLGERVWAWLRKPFATRPTAPATTINHNGLHVIDARKLGGDNCFGLECGWIDDSVGAGSKPAQMGEVRHGD